MGPFSLALPQPLPPRPQRKSLGDSQVSNLNSSSLMRSSLDVSRGSMLDKSSNSLASFMLASTTAASSGTFAASGITDLRASITAQQKQIDGLVDRVAALLSAMHAEVLQDVRVAFGDPSGEARLKEMKQVGEVLDVRLAQIRSEAEEMKSGGGLREWVEGNLGKLHHALSQDLQESHGQIQRYLHEALSAHQDRHAAELQDVGRQLKTLDERLGSTETDVALISDDDADPMWRQAIEQSEASVRRELQDFAMVQLQSVTKRVDSLEERLLQEHAELLTALQQAAAASGAQGEQRERQKEFFERVHENARHQDAELGRLTGDLSKLASWASSVQENEAHNKNWRLLVDGQMKQLNAAAQQTLRLEQRLNSMAPTSAWEERLELVQAKMEAVLATVDKPQAAPTPPSVVVPQWLEQKIDAIGERLDAMGRSVSQESRTLGQQLVNLDGDLSSRADAMEKSIESLQKQVVALKDQSKSQIHSTAVASMVPPRPKNDSEHLLKMLERNVEAVAEELRQQLESQLNDAMRRTAQQVNDDLDAKIHRYEPPRPQMNPDTFRRELEERLLQTSNSSQRSVQELRQEVEVRSSKAERLGEELRKDFEVKFGQGQSTAQRLVDDLRHDVERGVSQTKESTQRLTEDVRRLGADLEVRLAQTQGSTQRLVAELRKDLESRMAETLAVSSTYWHEERLQVTTELRQELDRSVLQPGSTVQRLAEELKDVRACVEGAKGLAEETRREVSKLANTNRQETADGTTNALLELWESKLNERLDRCDAAAASCEQCADSVEKRLRDISNELRTQLATEGSKLVDILAPSLQSQDGAPMAAATAAAAAAAAEVFSAAEAGGSPLAAKAGFSLRGSPKAVSSIRPMELFRSSRTDLTFQDDHEDSDTQDLLKVLLNRVSQQETTLQELRNKNDELRSAMDGYNLEKKVHRSLAGLES
eukprot:TRINITY_DN31799_c0_g1_i1.p1 TRINITY_DN31799_c0_g1~~TRINITY_DN31799_c0_g1_i1.p1  ORF type:complete len:940 (+),score=221.31 TRINITY_DN31799_c0_g1_i1:44-2863(+)